MQIKSIAVLIYKIHRFMPILAGAAIIALTTSQSLAYKLSEQELKIWNSPVFKKQFVKSYMAETDIEPRVTTDEREKMAKILDLISSDQMDKASNMLEKNRGESANALYDFMLANIMFQREELDNAAAVYEIAVEKYSKFRRAWRNLGLIYVRKNEFQKALPALARVIELGGGDSITYGLLGFAYSSTDNNVSAETAFRMAILLDPATMDWKMGLARAFFKQQSYDQAAALCGALIDEHPENADLWLLQANAYIGLNKPIKAAENFEFVDSLGKSTTESLNMLGDIYINDKLYEMAVNSYIRALEKDEKHDPARAIRAANALTAFGFTKEAARLIASIEELTVENINSDSKKELLKLRARLAVAEGAGEEEARVLKEIVALDPLDGEALILLGQHYGRSGKDEKAIFYFERSANIEDFEAEAKLRHAQTLVKQGKYKKALPLLRKAQQIKPRNEVQKYLDQIERIAR